MEKRSGILWRGVVVTSILLMFGDTMAIPSWIIRETYIQAKLPLSVGLLPVLMLLLIQVLLNFTGLILASSILLEVDGGVFDYLFGWTVRSCKALDHLILSPAVFTPFSEQRGEVW